MRTAACKSSTLSTLAGEHDNGPQTLLRYPCFSFQLRPGDGGDGHQGVVFWTFAALDLEFFDNSVICQRHVRLLCLRALNLVFWKNSAGLVFSAPIA